MQYKDLEDFLQKKADETKAERDFSEVWADIKDQIIVEKPVKKFSFKKWLPTILASTALVVCLILTPILINALKPAPEILYFADGLTGQDVVENDMLNGLSQASIQHVSLSNYGMDACSLLVTEDNQVKGASFTMYDTSGTFLSTIKIYDKTVDAKINLQIYNSTYVVNNTTEVKYKLKSQNGSTYEYSVYAKHNNVQYVMEYTGFADNLIDFLNEFFA